MIERTAGNTGTYQSACAYSNAQPIWQLCLLSVITGGLYELRWFYRNWSQIKAYTQQDFSPGRRTAALAIPVVSLFAAYRQFDTIRENAHASGCTVYYNPVVVIASWMALFSLWWLPDPFWALSFFSCVPLIPVQMTLNHCWGKAQPGLPVRTRLSTRSVLVSIAAAVLWLFIILSMVSG